MNNPNVRNLVDSIADGKVSNLREDVNKVVGARAMDVVEARKIAVAKSFFSRPGEGSGVQE